MHSLEDGRVATDDRLRGYEVTPGLERADTGPRSRPQALLEKNLRERRALLREHLQAVDGEFAFATSEDASTVDEIQAFLDKSIKDGCEGLMVKMLEGEGASYEPSRRSIHWLKVRRRRCVFECLLSSLRLC